MTCRVLPRLLLALSLLAPASFLPGSIPLAAAADGSAALAQRPGQAAIASAHRLATDAGTKAETSPPIPAIWRTSVALIGRTAADAGRNTVCSSGAICAFMPAICIS